MALEIAAGTGALVVGILLLAGSVNGLAGFGFALVGTMALASVVDPATAVVFMIVPVMAVNLSLAAELSGDELRTCARRFWPLLATALVGTVLGLAVLGRLPDDPLRVGLGLLTLAFVTVSQDRVAVPGQARVEGWCFVERPAAMVGVGAVGGAVFGGTNVGVPIIAYLRSLDLSHGVFVGVVAAVFLGLNAIRVGAAGLLGLYPSAAVFLASVGGALPAVAGVALGRRGRAALESGPRRWIVLGLLALVGVRLVVAGLGIA